MHPSTVIDRKPDWLLYNEFVLTKKNYIRTVMIFEPSWLFEVAKEYFDLDEFPEGESKRKLIRVLNRVTGK